MKQVESTWACLKGALMSIYSSISTGVYMIHSSKQSLFISNWMPLLSRKQKTSKNKKRKIKIYVHSYI